MDAYGRLESIVRHLRYAVRALARTPLFTTAVAVTLALGIGANSAVFSAIDAVLLRPLPFPKSDELVSVAQSLPKQPGPFVAPIRLEEWNRLNSTFQAITGYYSQDESEVSGELPERLKRAFVAPRFLQVLRVAPVLGRDFSPEEEHFGGPNAVLISNRLWHRRFGGSAHVLRRTLRLGNWSWRIVGVMPASFRFPDRDVDLWSPSPMDAPYAQSRESTWFMTIGRLKPGVSLAEARANLATVQSNLGRQYPKTDAAIKVAVSPLKETTIHGVRKSLLILFGSVSLLLLIACTNIAALLLSRGAQRQHEISIRLSLGASQASIALQLLAEALIVAISGAALGLSVAAGASRIFRFLAKDLPRVEEIGLDWRIVLYSLACAIAVTLVCGIFPAVHAARKGLAGGLAHGGRSQVAGRSPAQFLLVGVQVALAVTLLAGAGLLLRSLQELSRVSPGFDPRHVLTFHISTSWAETGRKDLRQWTDRILEGLQSLPGVEATTVATSLPGVPSGYQVELKILEGRAESESEMLAQARWITPGYFATLHIPVLAGALCRDEANTTTVMVNRSFANAYLGGPAGIGKHLVIPGAAFGQPGEIAGIVGDVRELGLDHEPVPTVYWCNGITQPGSFFVVRTRDEPSAMTGTIRRKLHELEPRRSVYDVTPLTSHISDAYAEGRLRAILLALFAATALALACAGLYGTLSYLVNVRQREIGVRLALGALRTQIVQQFLGQGLRVSLLGSVAGLALAAASGRLLAGMLYGVSTTDVSTLAGVVAILLAISVLASLIPAIRAARVEPMRALREE